MNKRRAISTRELLRESWASLAAVAAVAARYARKRLSKLPSERRHAALFPKTS
jgi:hypothetical protein